ncbi:MAG: hypothetical protein MH204_01135 [Fimbriimonadaceae bacterium]|nr:hypothetical protein [Fimbriimonadaceae bacterium]
MRLLSGVTPAICALAAASAQPVPLADVQKGFEGQKQRLSGLAFAYSFTYRIGVFAAGKANQGSAQGIVRLMPAGLWVRNDYGRNPPQAGTFSTQGISRSFPWQGQTVATSPSNDAPIVVSANPDHWWDGDKTPAAGVAQLGRFWLADALRGRMTRAEKSADGTVLIFAENTQRIRLRLRVDPRRDWMIRSWTMTAPADEAGGVATTVLTTGGSKKTGSVSLPSEVRLRATYQVDGKTYLHHDHRFQIGSTVSEAAFPRSEFRLEPGARVRDDKDRTGVVQRSGAILWQKP